MPIKLLFKIWGPLKGLKQSEKEKENGNNFIVITVLTK